MRMPEMLLKRAHSLSLYIPICQNPEFILLRTHSPRTNLAFIARYPYGTPAAPLRHPCGLSKSASLPYVQRTKSPMPVRHPGDTRAIPVRPVRQPAAFTRLSKRTGIERTRYEPQDARKIFARCESDVDDHADRQILSQGSWRPKKNGS